MALDRLSPADLAPLRRKLDEADAGHESIQERLREMVKAAEATDDPDAAFIASVRASRMRITMPGCDIVEMISTTLADWKEAEKLLAEGLISPDGYFEMIGDVHTAYATVSKWVNSGAWSEAGSSIAYPRFSAPALVKVVPPPSDLIQFPHCGPDDPAQTLYRLVHEEAKRLEWVRDRLAAAYALPTAAPPPAREAAVPSDDQTAAPANVKPPPATPEPEPSPASEGASNAPTTSTATSPAREAVVPSDDQTAAQGNGSRETTHALPKGLKPPEEWQWRIYWTYKAHNISQADLARLAGSQLGRTMGQGQVSKAVNHVESWITSGGTTNKALPLKTGLPVRVFSLDPSELDGKVRTTNGRRKQKPYRDDA
jgi:hypothetical protein